MYQERLIMLLKGYDGVLYNGKQFIIFGGLLRSYIMDSLEKWVYLDNLSNMLTSFWASYSFCSSVISSMGLGMGSSTWPVIGLMLTQKWQQDEPYK